MGFDPAVLCAFEHRCFLTYALVTGTNGTKLASHGHAAYPRSQPQASQVPSQITECEVKGGVGANNRLGMRHLQLPRKRFVRRSRPKRE